MLQHGKCFKKFVVAIASHVSVFLPSFIYGSTAQFCVLDHRPVCADGKEKSAVATVCINEHFLKASGVQWLARQRARY
jgi:phosphodiesterase/alkaline phosphatase D-like protein